MANDLNLCMGCMRPLKDGATVCPHCGFDARTRQEPPFLETKTLLCGRYIVGKLLFDSPSDAQYLGFDLNDNMAVKIIEFLPKKFVNRQGGSLQLSVKDGCDRIYYECLGSFESLWKAVSNADSFGALDKVLDVFYLNNTVYAVTSYERCITLEEFFSNRQRLLSYNKARAALLPVMRAAQSLCSIGITHAEISPKTILVDQDGKLHLSGLFIPHAHGDLSEISLPPCDGFAPIERCNDTEHLGQSTDVYSLAAVFYTAISGSKVPPAQSRVGTDPFKISSTLQKKMPQSAFDALEKALEVFPSSRLRTIGDLIEALTVFDEPEQKTKVILPPSVPTPVYEPAAVPPAAMMQSENDKSGETEEEKDDSSPVAIAVKSFFCALLVLLMVFVTAYSTVLYKYIEVPILDSALSALNFLPMNSDSEKEAAKQTQPQTTAAEQTTAEKKTVVVADFSKLTYESIKSNDSFNKNFDLVFEFQQSDTKEKDSVISQSIPAGQTVEEGTQITIVVSKGKGVVVLDDVVGMSYAAAFNKLTAEGFVVEKITAENDGSHVPDEVCEMSLVSGLKFEKGTKVTLTVWGPRS